MSSSDVRSVIFWYGAHGSVSGSAQRCMTSLEWTSPVTVWPSGTGCDQYATGTEGVHGCVAHAEEKTANGIERRTVTA